MTDDNQIYFVIGESGAEEVAVRRGERGSSDADDSQDRDYSHISPYAQK